MNDSQKEFENENNNNNNNNNQLQLNPAIIDFQFEEVDENRSHYSTTTYNNDYMYRLEKRA